MQVGESEQRVPQRFEAWPNQLIQEHMYDSARRSLCRGGERGAIGGFRREKLSLWPYYVYGPRFWGKSLFASIVFD
jgi:hypothetical protein